MFRLRQVVSVEKALLDANILLVKPLVSPEAPKGQFLSRIKSGFGVEDQRKWRPFLWAFRLPGCFSRERRMGAYEDFVTFLHNRSLSLISARPGLMEAAPCVGKHALEDVDCLCCSDQSFDWIWRPIQINASILE